MSTHPSTRLVRTSTLGRKVCTIPIRARGNCCSPQCAKRIDPCIPQASDLELHFVDAETVNYTVASEITFDVYESRTGSASALLAYSLTGGTLILTQSNAFRVIITDTQSAALTRSRKWCEVWATSNGGSRSLLGAGPFKVFDTRKYD